MAAGSIVVDLLMNTGSFDTDIQRSTKAAERLSTKVQRKARSSGFAYPDLEAAADDVRSELAEVLEDPSASEAGDLLFAATGVAVQLQHDPEAALRGAAGRFRDRFVVVERLATKAGVEIADTDPATLDAWWQQAKRETA